MHSKLIIILGTNTAKLDQQLAKKSLFEIEIFVLVDMSLNQFETNFEFLIQKIYRTTFLFWPCQIYYYWCIILSETFSVSTQPKVSCPKFVASFLSPRAASGRENSISERGGICIRSQGFLCRQRSQHLCLCIFHLLKDAYRVIKGNAK